MRQASRLQHFIRSDKLAGSYSAFKDLKSWRPWLTFAKAVHGETLTTQVERNLFRQCAGRPYKARKGGYHEAVAIVGRQAGKTQFASLLVSMQAALHENVKDGHLYALLIAQDHRAAVRTAFAYIKAIFASSPTLKALVVNAKSDTLELSNGIRVAAYPCNPSSVRGLRAIVAVCDELAFYRSSEMIPQDKEMLRALRPCLATTGGRIVCPSSPYGQSGALWDLHRRYYGKDDAPTLVWQADAPTMNRTLPEDYLQRMKDDDPEAYRSEVLGEFRAGLSTLLDPEMIEAAVRQGSRENPPVPDLDYVAFVDPSGGRRDPYALAIGHREGPNAVVDVARRWQAPFNPTGVAAEVLNTLRPYGIRRVVGDRYAGEWPREQFRAQGLEYDTSSLDKSSLYLELLPALNGGLLEIPDDPVLIAELRGLERKRGPSGRDRVDHPPSGHDDLANAVAGVSHQLLGGQQDVSWSDLYGPHMRRTSAA